MNVLDLTLKIKLINGFRKSGTFSSGVEEFLARLPTTLNHNSTVDEAFIEHIKVKKSETTQPKKLKFLQEQTMHILMSC